MELHAPPLNTVQTRGLTSDPAAPHDENLVLSRGRDLVRFTLRCFSAGP